MFPRRSGAGGKGVQENYNRSKVHNLKNDRACKVRQGLTGDETWLNKFEKK